jgi:hypothetical protein
MIWSYTIELTPPFPRSDVQYRTPIAITAATINGRANDTDELVGLLKLWGEDQAA